MYKIAKNVAKEKRNELFINAGIKLGKNAAIIEKDFWVCLILDYLFHRCKWKNSIAFKGGTSLSKCYGLIKRFSEDIDLILDWRVLGYQIDEPLKERSKTKQDIFNKELTIKTEIFLDKEFIPELHKELCREVNCRFNCHIDKYDKQTIIIEYDNSFNNLSLLPIIRLEIGALASWSYIKNKKIMPYLSLAYPNLFSHSSTKILTVSAERTFWEKITILHKEANRKNNSNFPLRYSRHYYDVYYMSNTVVKNRALKNISLLNEVVEFKKKFYYCGWADYENAKIGTIKLMPNNYFISALKQDYEKIKNMIYGETPSFEQILKGIKQLEIEINNIKIK